MTDTLFDPDPAPGPDGPDHRPLAARLRPRSLEEVVGQEHLLGPDGPLAMLTTVGSGTSVVLHGPPGSGKTSVALLLGEKSRAHVVELSAVDAGVSQVRSAIHDARERLRRHARPTVLIIDEVHRFSRTQQDALLPAVENGWVTLIAATTENPSVSLVPPLLSRSLVLELRPLGDAALDTLVHRALDRPEGLRGRLTVEPDAAAQLRRLAAGDGRRVLTLLEACSAAVTGQDGRLTAATVAQVAQRVTLRYDRAGQAHYDLASALIKSVRGSDVDAALHYLARMAEAGEDPRFLARRLVILASEDVGLADPQALPLAVAGAQAVGLVGWPEARIVLAQVVIALALAPKSNAVLLAVDEAVADVHRLGGGAVPLHLRGAGYVYPHDDPRGVVAADYLPDLLSHADYYRPVGRGGEAALRQRWENLRAIIRRTETQE